MRSTTASILVGAALAGCATANVESEHVLVGNPSAAYPGSVKIVMESIAVPGEYDEVAIVSATGSGSKASLPAVVGALQQEAAGLGCNAVIRVRYDRGESSATATGVAVRLK